MLVWTSREGPGRRKERNCPGAAGCPEDPSGPDRPNPLSHHRVTVPDVARNRLRIGPTEAVEGTLVVDIKAVLCEAQET